MARSVYFDKWSVNWGGLLIRVQLLNLYKDTLSLYLSGSGNIADIMQVLAYLISWLYAKHEAINRAHCGKECQMTHLCYAHIACLSTRKRIVVMSRVQIGGI